MSGNPSQNAPYPITIGHKAKMFYASPDLQGCTPIHH